MANAGLNFTDIWSIYHNQAGIAHLNNFSAGAFYENRFLISDLAFAGAAVAMPLGNGAIGLTYSNLGFSAYNEGKLGLAYGLKLSDALSIGVQLNYHSFNIAAEDHGSRGALTAEVGFQLQISKNVSLAAHIFNPTRTQLNDFVDERIPTVLRIGASYKIAEDLKLTGDVEKDIDADALFRAGIEYQPADKFYLRMGASSNPSLFAFGLGLDFDTFRFDLATTYHSVLGYSPQVSLTYSPSKK